MIPRLIPRRTTAPTSHQVLAAMGAENDDPTESSVLVHDATSRRTAMLKLAAASAASVAPSVGRASDEYQEPTCHTTLSPRTARRAGVLTSSTNLDAPLSPAVTQSYDFLMDPSSALTPPATVPRPLVVSAKRVAHNVRRQHSSKRLRRRCSATSVPNQSDKAAYCLWRDTGAPPRALESSSDEEEGGTLPCHPNPQGYWDFCYGSTGEGASKETNTKGRAMMMTPSWSASRKPPSKGCLSHRKSKSSSTQPTVKSFLTPPTTPEDEEEEGSPYPKKSMTGPRVQFGSPQAVEFDSEGPAVQLTPLPSEITRQRYSMVQVEPNEGESDMLAETKRNTALLAEWESDGPLQATSSATRRRQQRNKNRRSSSLFTPSPNSTSLLEESDDDTINMRDVGRDGSPSTIVLENLASLCVDSPSLEQSVLAPASPTSSDSSSSSCNETTAVSTADLAIPLDEINIHGAVDSMAVKTRLPSPDANNTAGGATMSLQAIHSVGGALGTASAHKGRELSPISRMSHSASLPPATPHFLHGRAMISSPPAMDIVQTLLKDPSADQTFDPKDIFFALVEDSQKQISQRRGRLAEIIHAVSPRWDGVLSCLEDLKEQVRFCANTRSNTKFRLPATQEALAKKMVRREWKDLENEFLMELSEVVERNTEHAKILNQTASRLLEGTTGMLVASKAKTVTSLGNGKTSAEQTEERLQQDITNLEVAIHERQKIAQIREAVEAPYAALFCQAASHIGVCGFRLDDYNGTVLQLTYEHPIAGVESQFTHDVAHGLWSARYLSDAFISSPELLPASHPAARFHEQVARACFAEKDGLLQRVRGMDLSDAVLILSLWLGGLDAVTQELVDISTSHTIAIDWPRLSISVDDKTTLALHYGESSCQSLRQVSGVVTQGQKETHMDISGTLTGMVEHAIELTTK